LGQQLSVTSIKADEIVDSLKSDQARYSPPSPVCVLLGLTRFSPGLLSYSRATRAATERDGEFEREVLMVKKGELHATGAAEHRGKER